MHQHTAELLLPVPAWPKNASKIAFHPLLIEPGTPRSLIAALTCHLV